MTDYVSLPRRPGADVAWLAVVARVAIDCGAPFDAREEWISAALAEMSPAERERFWDLVTPGWDRRRGY